MQLLVSVFVQSQDEDLKGDANKLFQKLSPFRSVIYIYTNPTGAEVLINDKKVEQKTPLILHEMHLGSYKVHIKKPGYKPVDLNLSLSVNEFNPIIVDLQPIPE